MQLYIKQKVFSWGDKFTVRGPGGEDRYYVEGEVFTLGKKLHVYDTARREVAFIRQELWTWLPKFQVLCGGREVAQIRKELTFFYPKYAIDGLGWEIDGGILEHDYRIVKAGREIVTIRKEWMRWGDSYVLDIANPADELVALAVVLAIDCVTAAQTAASVSVGSD